MSFLVTCEVCDDEYDPRGVKPHVCTVEAVAAMTYRAAETASEVGFAQGQASCAAGPWIPVTAGPIPEDIDLFWWAPNWGAKVGAIMSQAAVDRNGGRGVAGGVYPGGGSVSGYSHWAEMRKP